MRACVWRYFIIQSLSHFWLFATPWTAACQASLCFIASQGLLMSFELVMPSNHLILCRPFLLLPSVFPSISLFQWVGFLHQVAEVMKVWRHEKIWCLFQEMMNSLGNLWRRKIIERKVKIVFWRAYYIWRERLVSTLNNEGRRFKCGSHVLLVIFKDSHLAAVHRMVWSETGKFGL